MVLDVLFDFQDVRLEVHEGTCVCFGSQGSLGKNVLWNPLQEGHDTLILSTLLGEKTP